MLSVSLLFLGALLVPTSSAAPRPDGTSSTTAAAPPLSTACGTIVNSQDLSDVYNSSLAFECLTSVPFNAAVATRFIKYINDTAQFQSNLAYLKDPPASYQQPAVDLVGGLSAIQGKIQSGVYQGQYAFEADLQLLLQSAHDSHLYLTAGAFSVFSFGSELEILSVSPDGMQLPKLYLKGDIEKIQTDDSFSASEIVAINGQDATGFLTDLAARNAYGTVEPHADWNQLFYSPALDIQGYGSVFGSNLIFYPGDTIAFTLANGTQIGPDPWNAYYWNPGYTGPLVTGGDFYNFFVLGFLPASYDDGSSSSGNDSSIDDSSSDDSSSDDSSSYTSNSSLTSWNSLSSAYPIHADIVQPDLNIEGGGFLTGYFLTDISTAVLSIPSFEEYSTTVDTFSSTVQDFLVKSKKQGMKKVVVDVQQNSGGNTFLAIDTFKRFFPSIEPFAGSRMRAQPYADAIGKQVTQYWDDFTGDEMESYYYYAMSTVEWVVTDRLDAESGKNFSSWEDFYGPKGSYNEDSFTSVQRYNLSSFIVDWEALGNDNNTAVYGYAGNPVTLAQPYSAEDIVILTDGLCHSACSLFMEMMKHDAGVRSAVVGGKPTYGPMQAPSGTRGAAFYSSTDLDNYIDFAEGLDSTGATNATLPAREEDVWISYFSINLRDQIRPNDTVPLQFVYEAADCRIFFTPQTVLNMTNLWKYAANAMWKNSSLCIQGSTGHATTGLNVTNTEGPSIDYGTTYANISDMPDLPGSTEGLSDDAVQSVKVQSVSGKECQSKDVFTSRGCAPNQICAPVKSCIGGQKSPQLVHQCVLGCSTVHTTCRNCQFFKVLDANRNIRAGYCPLQSSFISGSNCGPSTKPGRPPPLLR